MTNSDDWLLTDEAADVLAELIRVQATGNKASLDVDDCREVLAQLSEAREHADV